MQIGETTQERLNHDNTNNQANQEETVCALYGALEAEAEDEEPIE